MAKSGNYLLKMFDKISAMPFGKALFSFVFCTKAPYFLTIRPSVNQLSNGFGQ
jgi:hypothetical protein